MRRVLPVSRRVSYQGFSLNLVVIIGVNRDASEHRVLRDTLAVGIDWVLHPPAEDSHARTASLGAFRSDVFHRRDTRFTGTQR